MKKTWLVLVLLAASFLLLVGAGILFFLGGSTNGVTQPSAVIPSPSADIPANTPAPPTDNPAVAGTDEPPSDQLFITVERQGYADGDLQLVIPKLAVDVPVLAGVTLEVLAQGVGLYDYAQLPGEGNRNVSIAGHRNGLRNGIITDNMPFYYIDTLEAGDFLYLVHGTTVYQYLYEDTTVVEPDDWGPIYSQGFSCITLTSCTPIGVADHRIIVRGRLAQSYAVGDVTQLPTSQKEH